MPDTMLKPIGFRRYRFDFGSDEKLHTISFQGDMPPEEIQKMLKAVQAHPYQGMADAIRAYLERGGLKYTGFRFGGIPADLGKTMEAVAFALHSGTCKAIDRMAGDADFYYATIDCQQNGPDGWCRGCYLAARKLPHGDGGRECNVVGQTFSSGKYGLDEHGFFAIRASGRDGRLYDIDKAEGALVLPSFGCVDVAALLVGIGEIKTKAQAKEIAEK